MPSAPFRLNRSGVMLAIVSAALASEAGAAAGRTEFVIGGVTVARNGTERPLARGTELDNGDTVRTNDGRAQIRFTDGAYVSLQPNTEYSIRDYRYDGAGGAEESGFFSLLKGAMRTVTGAIGRLNRNAYRIATPTATVGIRGTGGVIQVQDDGSTRVIGTSGIWSLTNPSGSVDVPAGTSAVAPSDPNQPPQETTQQPTSGPAPVPEEEPVFVAGEEVDEEGLPVIPQSPQGLMQSGPGYAGALAFSPVGLDGGPDGTITFDSSDRVTQAISPDGGLYRLESGSHADNGSDGILAWGRWIGTVNVPLFCDGPCTQSLQTYNANQGFHYVVGLPTASMPTQGAATYTLLGATSPTYVDGLNAPGTFSGTLSASFGATTTVVGDFSVSMSDGAGYSWRSSAGQFSGPFFSAFGAIAAGSGGACTASSCTADVQGFFAGANAERVGISYSIQDPRLVGQQQVSREVHGAAAFQQGTAPVQQQALRAGGL